MAHSEHAVHALLHHAGFIMALLLLTTLNVAHNATVLRTKHLGLLIQRLPFSAQGKALLCVSFCDDMTLQSELPPRQGC